MTRLFFTSVLLLALASPLLFAAPGDIPLSVTLEAPMPGLWTIAAASSGSDYLVAFASPEAVYWQRVDLNGEAIDLRPRRIPNSRTGQEIHATWSGKHYFVYFHDSVNLFQTRVSPSGEEQTRSLGPLGRVYSIHSSRGETAFLTAGSPPNLTIMDADGNVLRQSQVTGLFGLFRTDNGWRAMQQSGPSSSLGYSIVNAETGALISTPITRAIHQLTVIPSPAGGALLLTNDGEQPLAVDHQDVVREVTGDAFGRWELASGHRDGWMVIVRNLSEPARILTIGLDGRIVEQREIHLPTREKHMARIVASALRSHHLLVTAASLGVHVAEIDGATVRVHAPLGIGESRQMAARIARGPGVDLVAWRENSFSGWSVRATRVREGVPLDTAGLLLGNSATPDPPAVVFDGEAFVVAWNGESTIFVQRVGVDGSPLESSQRSTLARNPALSSRGDGRALLSWVWNYAASGTLISRGIAGNTISDLMPPHVWVTHTAHAFDGDSFLVVGSDESVPGFPGQILHQQTWVRVLNADGTPRGAAVEVNEGYLSSGASPLPQADGWIAPVRTWHVLELIQTTKAGIPHRRVPTIDGELMRASGDLMIWGPHHRGVMDETLRAEWFEPLPIGGDEENGGALDDGSFLLVRSSERYAVRPVMPHARKADLGITVTRSREMSARNDVFRIEHRGGDVIPSMRVGVSGGARTLPWSSIPPHVSTDHSITDGKLYGRPSGASISGPFYPGDSVEIIVHWSVLASRDLFVWALPDARDERAEDNFVVISAVEKRRLINRGDP